jgi:hypothetical protein
MVEKKEIKVTYKKSRNPRSVKLWDTEYLYTAMQNAVDIKHNIEELSTRTDTPLTEIGLIQIPAEDLWFLLDAYTDAYKRLMKEALITSGNISKIQPTLN